MVFYNEKAIDRLIDISNEVDPEASSHWQYYHSDFKANKDWSLGGLQRPFYRPYDGPIRHRLVKLGRI